MTFGDPRWLWGLLAMPLLLALEWSAVVRADRRLRELVGERADSVLLEQRRAGQRRLSLVLRALALALLVAGAADPQWGRELVRRGASGSDVVLAIDVSASMDTRDVAPSRLEEARREALAVLDRLEGSRVGLVAFAGDAVRLCPLTLDLGAVRLALQGLGSGAVSEPGTDIGRALRTAARVMPGGRREEQAIVLWTDGEDLEHGAGAAIDDLARTGMRVFTVGVGTPAGDFVPLLDGEGRSVDVKRDESGQPVRSRLDEQLLRSCAAKTRGGYFSASRPGGELPRLVASLSSLARSGRGQRLIERPVSRFPFLAALAALLLVLDRVRTRRRIPKRDDAAPRNARRAPAAEPRSVARGAGAAAGRAAAVLMCAGGALLASSGIARGQSDWARGDQAFKRGNWEAAESLYTQRLKQGSARAAEVNRATARARRGLGAPADSELGALSARGDAAGRAAGYNLGTLEAERQDYDHALGELRRALERDPRDQDARWNYELAMRLKQAQQNPQKPPQNSKPKPQPSAPNAGSGQPQPAPGTPPPGQPPPSPAQQPLSQNTGPGSSGSMNQQQADQILDALDQQARLQQGKNQVRVVREKRGRDW
jgi:Ca-activated chloride channel family protein